MTSKEASVRKRKRKRQREEGREREEEREILHRMNDQIIFSFGPVYFQKILCACLCNTL